jgi:diketogulonate reductase-like aldo/keto reductase
MSANRNPTFLYGTAWKEDDTRRCVEDAISSGFRGIDTANQRKHYFEAAVGEALKAVLKEGKITRDELFIQSKFTSVHGQDQRLPYDANAPLRLQVEQSFSSSLEHLHTEYLDSYVLHGPLTSRGLIAGDWEIWGAMEEVYKEGRAKALGISNVGLAQLQSLCEKARVKPGFVQNRCFARTGWDREIRSFCDRNKIIYQGFSLLTANPEIFRHPRFREILERTGFTPAQTVFRFALQVGMLPLTGTTDKDHMTEDLESLNIQLSADDIRTIEGLVG